MAEKQPRYEVETEFKSGIRTNVYRGNDRQKAHDTCEFWDERQDTYFIDHVMDELTMTPLDRANRKFDAKISELLGAA